MNISTFEITYTNMHVWKLKWKFIPSILFVRGQVRLMFYAANLTFCVILTITIQLTNVQEEFSEGKIINFVWLVFIGLSW